MRVFITGGTGTIGEAVIKELRRAGHTVTGLSRSEASDAKPRALGATPHRGALDQSARLVIEKRAQGIFHGVDGASPSLASVARAVSAAMGKGGQTSSLPAEEARAKMGLGADALCTDQLVITKRSAELGWRATHPTLDTDSGAEAAVADGRHAVLATGAFRNPSYVGAAFLVVIGLGAFVAFGERK